MKILFYNPSRTCGESDPRGTFHFYKDNWEYLSYSRRTRQGIEKAATRISLPSRKPNTGSSWTGCNPFVHVVFIISSSLGLSDLASDVDPFLSTHNWSQTIQVESYILF